MKRFARLAMTLVLVAAPAVALADYHDGTGSWFGEHPSKAGVSSEQEATFEQQEAPAVSTEEERPFAVDEADIG